MKRPRSGRSSCRFRTLPCTTGTGATSPGTPSLFHEFVGMLGSPNLSVRSVKFEGVEFCRRIEVDAEDGGENDSTEDDDITDADSVLGDDGGFAVAIREGDLRDLFGDVLPRHRTLEEIVFDSCDVPEACFERFTSSLPASATGPPTLAGDDDDEARARARRIVTPLKALTLEVRHVGTFVQSVADMVGRNALVSSLTLSASRGLRPHEFQLVCDGLPHNTHLGSLTVDLHRVEDDTLDLALAPASPLRRLRLRLCEALAAAAAAGPPGGATAAPLARLLKTNVKLAALSVTVLSGSRWDESQLAAIESVLETHNFTLQELSDGGTNGDDRHHHLLQGSRIGQCLRRNRWIHHVLRVWPNYQVPSQALWPAVLVRADSCPTLLYRFARRGNLPVWCGVVVVARRVVGGGVAVAGGGGGAAAATKQQPHPRAATRRSTRKRKARGG
jgi:hypothetical protein